MEAASDDITQERYESDLDPGEGVQKITVARVNDDIRLRAETQFAGAAVLVERNPDGHSLRIANPARAIADRRQSRLRIDRAVRDGEAIAAHKTRINAARPDIERDLRRRANPDALEIILAKFRVDPDVADVDEGQRRLAFVHHLPDRKLKIGDAALGGRENSGARDIEARLLKRGERIPDLRIACALRAETLARFFDLGFGADDFGLRRFKLGLHLRGHRFW